MPLFQFHERDPHHGWSPNPASTVSIVMQRFIQSVALALLALIAVQPVLAASSCLESLHRRGECREICCSMHAHGMNASEHSVCASHGDALAVAGCVHANCFVTTPALFQTFRPVFVEPAPSALHTSATLLSSSSPITSATPAKLDIAAPAPPRRILLRTFRI
jgi:hypothetical protein